MTQTMCLFFCRHSGYKRTEVRSGGGEEGRRRGGSSNPQIDACSSAVDGKSICTRLAACSSFPHIWFLFEDLLRRRVLT